jgi:hypothetical protein
VRRAAAARRLRRWRRLQVGPLEEGQGEFDLDTSPEELLASELALVATGGGEDLGCALVAPYGANLG